MIIHWQEYVEKCPLTMQVIEKATGFKYASIYGTMIKDNKQMNAVDLYEFFDEHGWFCQVLKMNHPLWNGVISDSADNIIYHDPASFQAAQVVSRPHAESMLFAIAIMNFEEQLKTWVKWDEITVMSHKEAVLDSSKSVIGENLNPSDLNHAANEQMAISEVFGVNDGGLVKVMKSTRSFPWVGLILVKPKN